ncbi:eukaryotic translation initiation factor 4E transporter isoform X2 [Aethina tumida]|uniref:eukaryotic translation initiation factor 4E transporter isoform X2 n=1 Tax=Aethina tumida TaxID=116153 RepID=UPI00096B1B4D|nr:eukaryotic translation initiation factor 4E transporter isoform X2 [Aethina tumida]
MSMSEASDADVQEQTRTGGDGQSNRNGDEQTGGGMSVSDAPEFSDPAILEVYNATRRRYTRDELLALKDAPMSQKRPDFLDITEVPNQILDPEKWNIERKKSDTPTEGTLKPGGDVVDPRRRPGDARERIRKENDGIVLSPQRRSFNSGCFVPVTRPNRAHSPIGKSEPGAHIGVREIQPASRRIGSGRIVRDWDSGDKTGPGGVADPMGGGDYVGVGFRRQNSMGAVPNSGAGDDRTDRGERGGGRSFAGFDMTREKEREPGRRNGRYDRRRLDSSREDEPEWFSGGPVSQNDTIELRGFDDADKPTTGKMKRGAKRAKEWAKKKGDVAQTVPEERGDDDGVKDHQHQQPRTGGPGKKTPANGAQSDERGAGDASNARADGEVNDHLSIFEDIFKADNISLLTNGVGGDGDNKKSRFASWFKKESPEKEAAARRASMNDENNAIVKGILKDIGASEAAGTSVQIPGDAEKYFAPISPAASTQQGGKKGVNHHAPPAQKIDIMEMLRGRTPNDRQDRNLAEMTGKIMKLDELESKLRQPSNEMPPGMQQQQQQKPQMKQEEEMVAFKRLLAQVNGGVAVTATNGPVPKATPMSLLEMLQHSQQQDEAARRAHMMGGGGGGPVSPAAMQGLHASAAHTDLLKLQQQQQQQQQKIDMFSKLIGSAQMRGPSPLHELGMQQSRELLQRPEAQAILHAMHQRIPSPRELQIHTQNILQKALIKKKLEEQTENYRKKQQEQAQQHRGQSPNPNVNASKSVSSPTPLAFTPTSVLRKMTADKDEGKENKEKLPQGRALTGARQQSQQQGQVTVQQWNQQFAGVKQPAGRPIVKANANYQATNAAEQFFNQQRMYNQQRKLQQQQQQQYAALNNNSQQQQQQPSSGLQPGHHMGQYPIAPNQQPSFSSQQHQLTQHQLRAQHQQRAPPAADRAPQPQQQAGGQQQLAYQQQQQPTSQAWQQFLSNAQHSNRNSQMGRGGGGGNGAMDGDLSPTTTNQLARWFSPDLLERARGGELPSTATLAQVLSLEEIERQTAPPVHN